MEAPRGGRHRPQVFHSSHTSQGHPLPDMTPQLHSAEPDRGSAERARTFPTHGAVAGAGARRRGEARGKATAPLALCRPHSINPLQDGSWRLTGLGWNPENPSPASSQLRDPGGITFLSEAWFPPLG